MDKDEFEQRTELFRQQVGNDELFEEIQKEARQDERVQDMAARIREMRLAGRTIEASSLVGENRDLIDAVRSEVLARRGQQSSIEELERKLEERRKAELEKIHQNLTGEETESELLSAFHLTDEEGKLDENSLDSPLFRERTKMAFDAYRKSVISFEALVDYNRMTGVPTQNVGRADKMRGEAHNEVARRVADDLGLQFGTARRLVAKMRDGVAPGSGEQDAYARSIMRIGRRLSKRYGADLAEVMQDDLGSILESDGATDSDDRPASN